MVHHPYFQQLFTNGLSVAVQVIEIESNDEQPGRSTVGQIGAKEVFLLA